ncbi:MAG: HNH endonuclease [Succinivibrio sp.]|nr:HNH endonuclease [Succinivibrio sp.]
MSVLPSNILFCRVDPHWFRIVNTSYITTGSSEVNCWNSKSAFHGSWVIDPQPGSLALFIMGIGEHEYVVGGGFFSGQVDMSMSSAWNCFGVRNGVMDLNDFAEQVRIRGGNPEDQIECSKFNSVFIFSKKENIEIPDEFIGDVVDVDRFHIPVAKPLGRYLCKIALARRDLHLQKSGNANDWPGIYLMATQRNTYSLTSSFKLQLLNHYGNRCAITGSDNSLLLDVAHIKTFFDDKFHAPDNGIVMRVDLHRLFAWGYITAYYKTPDKVLVKVSHTVKEHKAEEYLKYDGKELLLPEDRALWPNPEYLKWHLEVRFENWLRFGLVKPADNLSA